MSSYGSSAIVGNRVSRGGVVERLVGDGWMSRHKELGTPAAPAPLELVTAKDSQSATLAG
jgi:hypothetical protein